MNSLESLRTELKKLSNQKKSKLYQKYFKTGKGEYGEGDIFLGISVPEQRKIAKKYFQDLNLKEIQALLKSKIHEERFTALEALNFMYEKDSEKPKGKEIFDFYLENTKYINNWDLVDTSAPYIVGHYLFDKDKTVLHKLAKSSDLWEKRIAIISTFYFIKNNNFKETLEIANILLNDKHDLIHKAVGWMLREIGNKDLEIEEKFLKENYKKMPRTMLRYAIEKFPEEKKKKISERRNMKSSKTFTELLNFSLINIDKPSGPTSFQISDFVRESLNLSKTSHMGTLDPQVTGVLPITLGRACRLSEQFMHKDKTYIGIMRLHENIEEKKLKTEIKNFIGKIKQLPPVRSRVKREVREREIKTFKILEIQEKDILFETEVEAGTYIRKLIHDLGEKIGGAHMLELRRTKAGIFDEKTAITLYEFEKAIKENYLEKYLVPAEEAIKKVLPTVQISDKNLKKILTGKPLMKEDIKGKTSDAEKFAAFLKERFIGTYHKVNEGDIIAKADFVFN